MAIRIRKVRGKIIALCANLSKEKKDDIYLDDAIHHTLSTKFMLDFMSEGLIAKRDCVADETLYSRIRKEQGGKLY